MIVKPGDISTRVGLEDNIWYDEERTRLATNRDQVERILVIAKALGVYLIPIKKQERF